MTTGSSSDHNDSRVRKYFRLVVRSEDGGTIFRKDFFANNLFGHTIELIVSNLIKAGLLTEGVSYSALVIPRYGDNPQLNPRVFIDSKPRKERVSGWLSIKFEGDWLPDKPITYLTAEVRVKGMVLAFRQDFTLKIEHVVSRGESVLENVHDQHGDDKVIYELFAREDSECELVPNKVYLSKAEADELVEISPDDDAQVQIPEKSFESYTIEETVGIEPPPDAVRIVMTRSTLTAVQAIARNGAKVEEGGVLVGNVFKLSSSSAYLVEISGHIFAEEARGSQFELRYTFESWQKRTAELKENFPGRRIVGWYHTHLLKAKIFDEEARQTVMTEHFFSSSDHFMHRQFFPEKWYVAMVLNPAGEAAFFEWNGKEIVQSRGFYVIADESSSEPAGSSNA